MVNHWENPFSSTSVATTYAAMTGSAFSVTIAGMLQEVIVYVAGDAVTSLIEAGNVRLTCKSWGGREVIVPFSGANIRTAPAFPIPISHLKGIGLPVVLGDQIVAQVIHVTGATPVTPQINCAMGFDT